MRHRSLLAGAMVGLWSWHGLTSAEAVACSPILPRPVLTDPALEGSETTPPTLVFVEVYNLQRGYSPADTTSSCADMAWLELLPYGEDDQTASSDLRYRVEYVSGFKPMSIDPEPLEYLSFPWADPKPSL